MNHKSITIKPCKGSSIRPNFTGYQNQQGKISGKFLAVLFGICLLGVGLFASSHWLSKSDNPQVQTKQEQTKNDAKNPLNAPIYQKNHPQKHPEKIVTLDIGVADSLNALGVPIAGIPDNLYIDELTIENAEVVGTLFEPNIEKLHAMKPDWILLATLSANKVDAVKSIAPTSDVSLKGDKPYEESLARLIQFGDVFDKQQEAQAWQKRLNTLRNQVRDKVTAYNAKNPNNKAIILLSNGNKISVFGKHSRFGWLGKQLEFNLVQLDNEGEHGAPVSFEYIAKINPDWILVIDRASAMGLDDTPNAKTVLDNNLVKQTIAGKKDQIIYLRAKDMYVTVGGVQSIERVLKQLDKRLVGLINEI